MDFIGFRACHFSVYFLCVELHLGGEEKLGKVSTIDHLKRRRKTLESFSDSLRNVSIRPDIETGKPAEDLERSEMVCDGSMTPIGRFLFVKFIVSSPISSVEFFLDHATQLFKKNLKSEVFLAVVIYIVSNKLQFFCNTGVFCLFEKTQKFSSMKI